MVVLGTALQNRLLGVARRELGADGEATVRATAQRTFDRPLDQLTYAELPVLFAAIERQESSPATGRDAALALATAIDGLRSGCDAGLGAVVVGLVGKRLGSAAEPFLVKICAKLEIRLDSLDRAALPGLADAARRDAAVLLGTDGADAVASAVLDARAVRPADLVAQIAGLAREHLGPDGETIVRAICRERLEAELDEVDVEGLAVLARAVERDAPGRVRDTRAGTFLTAAKLAVASPSEPLRVKISELASREIGPAGPVFVKKACAKHGMPFEAIDFEHIAWFAEVIRGEATPIIGRKTADELAHGIRAFVTGH